MRIAALLLAGTALGVVSRIDERSDAFAGVSTHAVWLVAAFAAGGIAARSPWGGATAGGTALTAANLAYYAWIATTEPGTELASVAGPPAQWLALGIASGAPLGLAGTLARRGAPLLRVGAVAVLAIAVAGDALGAFDVILP